MERDEGRENKRKRRRQRCNSSTNSSHIKQIKIIFYSRLDIIINGRLKKMLRTSTKEPAQVRAGAGSGAAAVGGEDCLRGQDWDESYKAFLTPDPTGESPTHSILSLFTCTHVHVYTCIDTHTYTPIHCFFFGGYRKSHHRTWLNCMFKSVNLGKELTRKTGGGLVEGGVWTLQQVCWAF